MSAVTELGELRAGGRAQSRTVSDDNSVKVSVGLIVFAPSVSVPLSLVFVPVGVSVRLVSVSALVSVSVCQQSLYRVSFPLTLGRR